jgi:hypothetical protein
MKRPKGRTFGASIATIFYLTILLLLFGLGMSVYHPVSAMDRQCITPTPQITVTPWRPTQAPTDTEGWVPDPPTRTPAMSTWTVIPPTETPRPVITATLVPPTETASPEVTIIPPTIGVTVTPKTPACQPAFTGKVVHSYQDGDLVCNIEGPAVIPIAAEYVQLACTCQHPGMTWHTDSIHSFEIWETCQGEQFLVSMDHVNYSIYWKFGEYCDVSNCE